MKDLVKEIEKMDLYEILQYTADIYGCQTAVTNCWSDLGEWKGHSYEELLEDVEKLSASLQEQLREGTHIALCAPNSYDWIVSFFAGVCSGNVVIPLDAQMTEDELGSALKAADVQILVSERKCPAFDVRNYLLTEFIELKTSEHSGFRHINRRSGPSMMLMTSGVTAYPKYVMLSQKNLIFSALSGIDAVPIPSGKNVLSILPLHHSYELCCGLLYHLCCGSHIYVNGSKADFVKNLRIVSPRYLTAVPSIVASLLSLLKMESLRGEKSCVQKIEIIFCGGASADPAVLEEMKQYGILVLQGYGMTECAPAITFNRPDDFTADTVGSALRYVNVQIREGEVWVKGPNVMSGYYKNPEETERVLKNGWLRTGDAGHFDENGHLILTGRIKNIIVLKNGENVSPEELEEKILRSVSGVQYCRVYEESGSIVADLYAPGWTETATENLIRAVNEQTSSYKKIQEVHLLKHMPQVTALGKPFRRNCRDYSGHLKKEGGTGYE